MDVDVRAINEKIERESAFIDVSYTNLRAHETGRKRVCRLRHEKKKKANNPLGLLY